LRGRKVRTLFDGQQQAGTYKISWDGTDGNHLPVAAGVYFCRMEAGDFVNVIKLALVK
jgi:flagellar hook assembly protein FlgD